MAFVQFLANERQYRCGGVLVRKDFVLTAAHCWGSSIDVTLGAHNIQEQEKTQQAIPVSKAIRHQDYNSKNFSNDIMLLKLAREANQTTEVRPLSLPRGKAQVRPGQVCSVAGWGQVYQKGPYSDTLQEVELTIQKDQECESHLRNYYNSTIQLCAGDPKEKKSSFKGDSGGPLLCKSVIQGIVSYGRSDGGDQMEQRGLPALPALHGICTFLQQQRRQEQMWRVPGMRQLCADSSSLKMSVVLGAHNIKKMENSQQVIPVLKAFPHKDYNNNSKFSNIILLKLRNKAQLNWAVKTIAPPQSQDRVRPGQVCSMVAWGSLERGFQGPSHVLTTWPTALSPSEKRNLKLSALDKKHNETLQTSGTRLRPRPLPESPSFSLCFRGHHGGREAKPHSSPYMALVQFLVNERKNRCGGILLQRDFLNQCHPGGPQHPRPGEDPPGHPSGEKGQADCSCEAPQPAQGQGPGEARTGVQCGRLGESLNGPFSTTLHQAELTLQQWASQVFEGDPRKMKTSFKGDSGGPLVCNNVIQGIFSYGQSNETLLGFYMKVSHFLPWIKRTMKRL
ncbi:hypothetical protein HPG69_002228 [Diceros bicornis minor]|uniref:Peptidase S1 domain-containing protein n=2 Tax=Boreoeutheria TaxID=1437010 RepID=A0A7J7FD05_DICBM|nr:hypothetical protein HPG69_002228 [Diceros bicornis minor]